MNSLLVVVGLLAASAVAQDKDLPELPVDFSLSIGNLNLSLSLSICLSICLSIYLSPYTQSHISPKRRKKKTIKYFPVFSLFLFLFFG
jgi:hypothetical protein